MPRSDHPVKRPLARAMRISLNTSVAFLILTGTSYIANASAAPHEHFIGFGWQTTEFDVKPFSDDVPPEWNKALKSAVATWNSAHSSVNITIDENSRNTVDFAETFTVDDHRDAEYRKFCMPTGCWFEIRIDSDRKYGGPEEVALTGEFLILHELGHALGLNDFEPESQDQYSVMAFYEMSNQKPTLHDYDFELIQERVRVIESGELFLLETFTLGVLKPASEWVTSSVAALTPKMRAPKVSTEMYERFSHSESIDKEIDFVADKHLKDLIWSVK